MREASNLIYGGIAIVLTVAALVPSLMPWWKKFVVAVVLYAGIWLVCFFAAVISLEGVTRGEGPAAFGLALFFGGTGALFMGSCSLRILVVFAQWVVDAYRKRKESKA
jgi:hypothetical protein